MNKPELIAPVTAPEALYFVNKPFQARTDEDGWRKEADQAAVAANAAAWERALQEKATDALVHGQFRKASFFNEYAATATVQELRPTRSQGGEGLALFGMHALASEVHPISTQQEQE
jgi:hypothetical protein